MKKLKMSLVISIIATISIYIYSTFASAVNVEYDFENGHSPGWTALYNNANMSIETEDNGNHYLKLSYNGQANRQREYYDVKVTDITNNGIIQVDYDIMYTETEIAKNGEIQFKNRTGPGSSETSMVARVGKHRRRGDGSLVLSVLFNQTTEPSPCLIR